MNLVRLAEGWQNIGSILWVSGRPPLRLSLQGLSFPGRFVSPFQASSFLSFCRRDVEKVQFSLVGMLHHISERLSSVIRIPSKRLARPFWAERFRQMSTRHICLVPAPWSRHRKARKAKKNSLAGIIVPSSWPGGGRGWPVSGASTTGEIGDWDARWHCTAASYCS